MKPIGEVIRRARKGRGWSLAKLGRAAEMDVSYLSRLETGDIVSPGVFQIERILDALDLPCTAIFGRPEGDERRVGRVACRLPSPAAGAPDYFAEAVASLLEQAPEPERQILAGLLALRRRHELAEKPGSSDPESHVHESESSRVVEGMGIEADD